MDYLEDIDYNQPGFGDLYDELPLWSARFGVLLLDQVPIRNGMTILDVGSGSGFLTLELAQRCGPDSTVIAVDPWEPGMTRLRRKLDRLGITNVVLLEQDATAMSLAPESVDLIVSNLGINNFDDAPGVLQACFRAAKPGAKVFLTTNLEGHMREFYEVYGATLIELGRSDRLDALDAHIKHRGTVESVSALIRDAGFEVVKVTTAPFKMRFADGSSLLRHYFIRLGFVPGWKAVVEGQRLEETFEALERNLNTAAATRGELSLTIPAVCFEAARPDKK